MNILYLPRLDWECSIIRGSSGLRRLEQQRLDQENPHLEPQIIMKEYMRRLTNENVQVVPKAQLNRQCMLDIHM